jgi:hypothetical protein
MKGFGFATSLIALTLAVCLLVGGLIANRLDAVLDTLDEGEWLADQGDFPGAGEAVLSALSLWEDDLWLYSIAFPAQHTETVSSALQALRETLFCEEYTEYKTANTVLVAAILHLRQRSIATLENVL